MGNEVPQNNLVQFLKYFIESFYKLKFYETRKVEHFRPPNSYILHCHGESGLSTLYLKGNDMKKTKYGNY